MGDKEEELAGLDAAGYRSSDDSDFEYDANEDEGVPLPKAGAKPKAGSNAKSRKRKAPAAAGKATAGRGARPGGRKKTCVLLCPCPRVRHARRRRGGLLW